MKKRVKLVLSKETLRALTPGQLPEVNGGAVPTTTSMDPYCFATVQSFCPPCRD